MQNGQTINPDFPEFFKTCKIWHSEQSCRDPLVCMSPDIAYVYRANLVNAKGSGQFGARGTLDLCTHTHILVSEPTNLQEPFDYERLITSENAQIARCGGQCHGQVRHHRDLRRYDTALYLPKQSQENERSKYWLIKMFDKSQSECSRRLLVT